VDEWRSLAEQGSANAILSFRTGFSTAPPTGLGGAMIAAGPGGAQHQLAERD
jgi:hypothetical protein